MSGQTENLLMGKYELKERIGAGSSGIVYLAWDRHLERHVAIKEAKCSAKQEENGMLKQEMEMLKSLKHPMLPAVYDFFLETKRYLVMEYIRGESLHNYIEREGAIPEKQACAWALQLLNLFSYLHGQKPPVIYRDLKPDNIIVCPDGNLRVVDFGTAYHVRYDSRAAHLAGTAGYAAPEQLCGEADERSDLYTIGATLYHMLTGHNPAGPPYGIRPVRCINPELTQDMEWIVEKCTKEEPSKRYQTVEELKTDLEKGTFFGRRHLFGTIGKKRRNQYPLRKLERRIWLTEKRQPDCLQPDFCSAVCARECCPCRRTGEKRRYPLLYTISRGKKSLSVMTAPINRKGISCLNWSRNFLRKKDYLNFPSV